MEERARGLYYRDISNRMVCSRLGWGDHSEMIGRNRPWLFDDKQADTEDKEELMYMYKNEVAIRLYWSS